MKTLTELSGSLVRTAAAAVAEARRSLPKQEEAPVTPASVVAESAAEAAAPTAPEEAAAVAAPEGGEAAPTAEAAPAQPAAEPGESEAVKAALDEAVAKATGLSGDRLSMLRAAVELAGKRVSDVRLVRVFGAEEPVAGAKTSGGHQYLVDFYPAHMKQVPQLAKEERGRGRGGRGGGRGGGGGGAGRGGVGPKEGPGGFSMDSLREDRKNNGRGRPGGGRRPGGRGPGGGRGGPPSGAPK